MMRSRHICSHIPLLGQSLGNFPPARKQLPRLLKPEQARCS